MKATPPQIKLLIGTIGAFLMVFLIGYAYRFDGQAASLTLPFVLGFWVGSPVAVLWSVISFFRDRDMSPRYRLQMAGLTCLLLAIWAVIFFPALRGG